jgi:hypothetical protein
MPSLSGKRAIYPLVLLLLLVNLSTVLYTLPLNRVIELRLCQEHYERHDPSSMQPDGAIPEKLCKIDDIQRRLAWLQGIMETTLVVCGMRSNLCPLWKYRLTWSHRLLGDSIFQLRC